MTKEEARVLDANKRLNEQARATKSHDLDCGHTHGQGGEAVSTEGCRPETAPVAVPEPSAVTLQVGAVADIFSRLAVGIELDFHGERKDELIKQALAEIRPFLSGGQDLPLRPTEAMLDAARGLLMARSMNVPSSGYSLGEVARSGYYGELWGHILTDEERAIAHPLTKAHLADLIWRAMASAALANGVGQ